MDTRFPTIAPGRIHRWGGATLIVIPRAALQSASPHPPPLSPAERYIHRGLPPWPQAEWVAPAAARQAPGRRSLAAPVTEVEILPHLDGSPHVVVSGSPAPALNASNSHTAAALAPDPVGVDLCETASAPAVRRAAGRVLTAEERSHTDTGRPDDLAASWALKESAVKADRNSVFTDAPRHITTLGLQPPALSGPRRAMLWQTEGATGGAVLALVLTHRSRPPSIPAAHCPDPAG
ncbi:4'-phosphopantetheinyl transferase superfamily protein [Streptomyces sp. NPDC051219]|uniref:4'-phosphopantetheinyl transferase superfamily protein n=1 Tax=Streptomyces sp. NPDC051219 TaxID=3155283 RepID=UPI003434315A